MGPRLPLAVWREFTHPRAHRLVEAFINCSKCSFLFHARTAGAAELKVREKVHKSFQCGNVVIKALVQYLYDIRSQSTVTATHAPTTDLSRCRIRSGPIADVAKSSLLRTAPPRNATAHRPIIVAQPMGKWLGHEDGWYDFN